MANESGSDDNLCFFITRIGEEGSPEREQADGVIDAIVKPAAKELEPPDRRDVAERLVLALVVVVDHPGVEGILRLGDVVKVCW